ncbi:MAG: histidinol dehydrogenase [Planctomycetota bacterium]
MPIQTIDLDAPGGAEAARQVVQRLRLDPRSLFQDDEKTSAVQGILEDVAERGDAAVVDAIRKFDDAQFEAENLVATPQELAAAADRVNGTLIGHLEQAIEQVRLYQQHVMPASAVPELERGGLRLGMRYMPIDSAGCYVPGGKASYPSSLIHLVVPAQVAGVGQIVVTTPASRFGQSDLVLAAAHLLGGPTLVRCGGPAAVAALAFGTERVPRVDKIVGPGNSYVQIAKRLVSGGVGVDGFLGPSEVLVFADDSADAAFVASDLLAQAEHDPGSCFLLTSDKSLPQRVEAELDRQLNELSRRSAAEKALVEESAIIVASDESALFELASELAPEHLSVQTRDPRQTLASLPHAGCAFLGPWSPVAVGDYVAGPSHCLPTNTTARFGGGISVFEFLKRGGIVQYDEASLRHDASAAAELADAEGLDGHAKSVRLRLTRP